MQTSLQKCLGGINQVAITQEGWLRARAYNKRSGFGIRDSVLPSPAAFLSSSGSATCLCSRLRSDFNGTLDPDVSAAETQFRRNIREDAVWRPDGATRTQSYPSNLCDAHSLDTLMEQYTPWRPDVP